VPHVTIYGHCDDNIAIASADDIPGVGTGEFPASDSGEGFFEFSTGDVFRLWYSGGVWRVGDEHRTDAPLTVTHTPNQGPDSSDYSDELVVDGDFAWVRFCDRWPMTDADRAEALWLNQMCDEWEFIDLPPSLLTALYDWATTRREAPR
jgi:hypothetical protein